MLLPATMTMMMMMYATLRPPNLTHVQPHPQAIENMVKPRPNSFPHFPHFPGDLSAGRFVKTSISNFNYICFICAGVCAICFLRQTADTEM